MAWFKKKKSKTDKEIAPEQESPETTDVPDAKVPESEIAGAPESEVAAPSAESAKKRKGWFGKKKKETPAETAVPEPDVSDSEDRPEEPEKKGKKKRIPKKKKSEAVAPAPETADAPEPEVAAPSAEPEKKGKKKRAPKKKKSEAIAPEPEVAAPSAEPEKKGKKKRTPKKKKSEAVAPTPEIADAPEPEVAAPSAEPEKKGKKKRTPKKKKSEAVAPAPEIADAPEPEVAAPSAEPEKKRMGWFGKKKKETPPETTVPEPDVSASEDRPEAAVPPEEPAKKVKKKRPPKKKKADAVASEVADIEPVQDEAAPAEVAAGADTLPKADPKSNDGSKGLFGRLKSGLSKTRAILTTDIDELFLGNRKIDDDLLEEIEELLITSDMGVQTTMTLMEKIQKKAAKLSGADELKQVLKDEICQLMITETAVAPTVATKPHVIMVVGVNGVGKTTTIGKLSAQFAAEGKQVMLAAADTFRAAAVEQLVIWAERAGADIVKHRQNADPAAVAFDAVEAAVARGRDIVIVDTAGRLHTQVNLMEEIKKVRRAISKKIPDAPHEILLVLDATTGQNALSQASMFNETLGITGLVLTKLDGTARGGVVVSICNSLEIPLKYIGVGEQIEDLQKFDPIQFTDALFS
ncbi:hypothetical protein DENIS_5144 [Desulfonema ishimotonii]|uniref:Signal recognition particle receptor FtsY n=1 Tax=Desulfonema ishimotonii TaxID=45657 RepID=A0A401G4I0_9BACT|nr:signal recognition particle-docking protein FtsY [Desulfonema ishimotonii]GBC64126.1 hypothetical protein DENIS_5144 [Desulfonema ishimotonii]